MYPARIEQAIERIPAFGETGGKVARAIHGAVLGGGEGARKAADILHGVWLGHPLHPVLTDIPIGAWTLGMMCDLVAAQRGSEEAAKMADALTAIGAVAALPTAIAGVADYSAMDESAMPLATLHGLLNSAGLLLNVLSIRDRASGNRGRGVMLSTTAFGALMFSAWIGGEMVYRKRVGVDHGEGAAATEDWHAVLDEAELADRTPKRVDAGGTAVLLYRDGGRLRAIGAVCSHAGGPLDEGAFDGYCVECPWHQSVFDLRDGSVVHGPATYPEQAFETRVRDGKIEVRLRRTD
jgi:nitrite reductase/ring-hydroxylating ferredoxin subunit/uncharacterized membrane protein